MAAIALAGFDVGEAIPGDWQDGVQYSFGGSFEPVETVIERRSDGSLKFGNVETVGGRDTVHVIVEVEASSGFFSTKSVDTCALGTIAVE